MLVSVTLSSGASYAFGPSGCAVNGSDVSCFIGMLESAATVSMPTQITWNAIAGAVSIAVAVSSDLPDTVVANNTATAQVGSQVMDSDAPTLPQWGMLLFTVLLMRAVASSKNRER